MNQPSAEAQSIVELAEAIKELVRIAQLTGPLYGCVGQE